jgi:hypothetical protein
MVPGVWTAAITPQKPPSSVKLPPLILPASGWPMVPLTAYTPPVLVPPPPSTVDQSREYCPQSLTAEGRSKKEETK